jgi:hypothetical protein
MRGHSTTGADSDIIIISINQGRGEWIIDGYAVEGSKIVFILTFTGYVYV